MVFDSVPGKELFIHEPESLKPKLSFCYESTNIHKHERAKFLVQLKENDQEMPLLLLKKRVAEMPPSSYYALWKLPAFVKQFLIESISLVSSLEIRYLGMFIKHIK